MPNLTLKQGITSLELSLEARHVFQLILDRFQRGPDEQDGTTIKITDIAAAIGLSVSRVSLAIDELRFAGLMQSGVLPIEDSNVLSIPRICIHVEAVPNLLNTAAEHQFALGKADRRRCGTEWADMPDGSRHTATVSQNEGSELFTLEVVRVDKDEAGVSTKSPVFVANDIETPEQAWAEWDAMTVDAVRPDGPAQLELHTNGHSETLEQWLDKPTHEGTWDRKYDDEVGNPTIERMEVTHKGKYLFARPAGTVLDPNPIKHWGGAWKLVVEEAKVEAIV